MESSTAEATKAMEQGSAESSMPSSGDAMKRESMNGFMETMQNENMKSTSPMSSNTTNDGGTPKSIDLPKPHTMK